MTPGLALRLRTLFHRLQHGSLGVGSEFILFAGSTLMFQGSRLVVSLIAAAWVGPERFGIWNVLNLLLLYGAIVTLGVPNGMNREVPIQRGRGDENAARQIADLGFWFTMVSASIGAGLLLIAAMGGFAPQGDLPAAIWAIGLFVLWQGYIYLQMRLKSQGLFTQMSIQQALFALLLPLIVLPATYWWGVAGFVASQAVTVAVICSYLLYGDTPARVAWNWPLLSNLIRVGGPILLAGLLYNILTTVDRWVILQTLGIGALGQYSLAILCVGALSLFPAVIAQQIYPRMAFQYGKTGNKRDLIPLVRQQAVLTIAATTPLLGGAILVLPWAVSRWMPAYIPGIWPAQIVLVGLIAIAAASGAGNFLNTIGLTQWYLAAQASTIVVSIILSFSFVSLGWGLSGVALGSAGANFFFLITVWVVYTMVIRR